MTNSAAKAAGSQREQAALRSVSCMNCNVQAFLEGGRVQGTDLVPKLCVHLAAAAGANLKFPLLFSLHRDQTAAVVGMEGKPPWAGCPQDVPLISLFSEEKRCK
eukprot:scaffold142725_cov20-Tisochrysis_lutea.AAC.6